MSEATNLATYPSLVNKSVLITGGATGIGESIVEGFCRNQAKVAFIDLNEEAGNVLAQKTGATFVACDLRDIPAVKEAVAKCVEANGESIDVVVNNAAHDERHAWHEVTPEYWDDRIAVNLRHTFFVTQAVAQGMIDKKGGSIINFGSCSWMLGQGGFAAYTASKAGIHGMTRSFARDFGKHGIRANTIVPGWVMTQRQKDNWVTPEALAEMEQGMCLAGAVMPIDIANMTLWLAADDSKMCTANNFIVDGGWI